LHCAGDNYDAYEPPELPVHGEENRDPDFGRLITALLEIDPQKRLTPVQLYNAVVRKNFFSDLDYEGIIL
jgi:hypothetical protein